MKRNMQGVAAMVAGGIKGLGKGGAIRSHHAILAAAIGGVAALAPSASAVTLYVGEYTPGGVEQFGNAGTGAATYTGTPSQFVATGVNAFGLAVDAAGYVSVVPDTSSGKVSAYSSNGPSSLGTSLVPTSTAFGTHLGYATVYGNTLYVADSGSGVYSMTDNLPTSYGTVTGPIFGTTAGSQMANGSYTNGATNQYLYVNTGATMTAYALTANGLTIGTKAGTNVVTVPGGYTSATFGAVTVDPSGNVYATEYFTGVGVTLSSVVEMSGSGANPIFTATPVSLSGGSISLTGANLTGGSALGPDGNLYFGDNTLHQIDQLNLSTDTLDDYVNLGGTLDPFSIAFSPFTIVPEPASLSLLSLGAAGMLMRRRRVTRN